MGEKIYMNKIYRLYQVDSFTKEKFAGNPAGVVTNAEGLTDREMQRIARELNNSETAFIFSSQTEDYDIQVRFFTPSNEVPICGHATIAAHYVRAIENGLDNGRVIQKTGAGILPVDIMKENNDYKIIMTQGKIEMGSIIKGKEKAELLSALSISEADLLQNCPIQIVSTGHSKVMIGIKDNEVLNNLHPGNDGLTKLSRAIGCNGYYVFTLNTMDDILIRGRMFAPAIGINEDPVTGNANGPLGAYLIDHNLVSYEGESFRYTAKQGEAIGRAGTMEVEVFIKDNKPCKVTISGNAVITFQTELVI